MRILCEKLILILMGIILFLPGDISYEYIVALLVCLSCSLLLRVLNRPLYQYACIVAMVAIHIWLPFSRPFIALTVYTIVLLFDKRGLFANGLLLLSPNPVQVLCVLIANQFAWWSKDDVHFRQQMIGLRDSLVFDTLKLKRQQRQIEQEQVKNIELATLAERNRIAHRLHDSIGHVISSSILQVEALQVTTNEPQAKQQLEVLSDVLQTGMTDIRENLHNLYEESFHLKYRIEEALQVLKKRDVELHCSIDTVLPIAMKVDLISIVKELVTNCQKHSNSERVELYVVEQPSFITIHYRDNGTAIQHEQLNGIGLLAIEDTVKKYDGIMQVYTTRGFEVHLTMKKDSKLKGGV